MSIAVAQPVYPTAVLAIGEDSKSPIQVHYELPRAPSKLPKRVPAFDMLFTRDDIKDKLSDYLQNWLQKANIFEPVYDLYFGTLYNSLLYQENRFLSLAQAAETYHRRKTTRTQVPTAEYRRLRDAMLQAVPEEHRGWIEVKLRYINELNLRERLSELVAMLAPATDLFASDKDLFVRQVVETRNHYTHYSRRPSQHVASPRELFPLTQKLKVLVSMCLLYEVGFSPTEIRDLVARNERYRFDMGIQ